MAKKNTTRRSSKPKATGDTAAFERLLKKRADDTRRYVLKLFITGSTSRSSRAIENIRALCDEYLSGRYDLEVVDIYQQPTEATGEQIIAAPTLIRKFPKPSRRMVGDLSNKDRVLIGLDLHESDKAVSADDNTQWLKI
jgi:circadian clock protein KaiB